MYRSYVFNSFKAQKTAILLGLSLSVFPSFLWAGLKAEKSVEGAQVKYNFEPGEIDKTCDQVIEVTKKSIADLLQKSAQMEDQSEFGEGKPSLGFNALTVFEGIVSDFNEQQGSLTFMKDVSTQEALRKESAACEDKLNQYEIEIYTDRNLYLALKQQISLPTEQLRLREKILMNFEDNGLALPEEQQERVKQLNKTLASLELKFSTNVNEDKSQVEYTEEEMIGVPQGFIDGLKKLENGKRVVPVKGPNYVKIMENATVSETRKRILYAWENRAADSNVELFRQAVEIRKEIASLMGYSNWADFRLKARMAKNSETALGFLNNLKERLSRRNQTDLSKLLDFKKTLEPSATELKAWDLTYFAYQVKKAEYQLDDEVIKAYFPKDTVIQGMFEVYSRLLGVKIVELKEVKGWAEGVQFFQIRNEKTNEVVAYFYTDFEIREGKFGHAAAFGLRSGRRLDSGTYLAPVSAIVANFNAAEKGKPVLLSHREVQTLFHEFGHIMHQTLTQAPFASLGGSRVAKDFVEAPSQMLENWVFSEDVLTLLSGHYENPAQKLPSELLKKIKKAQDFNLGYFNTRQLIFGLFDMICHTSSDTVDPTALYAELYLELIGIPYIDGGHFVAGFGHLMGGYDAAYYGYLWSDVYASDMFTLFEDKGLMNSELGHRYRRTILEQGNMKDAMDLLREFLGREPNSDAFFKKLGSN